MMFRPALKYLFVAVVIFTAVSTIAPARNPQSPVMTLLVDETQAPRRIALVHEEIPARPGPLTLAYPRWIPGEHGPTGPIEQLAALRIRSGSTTLAWTRNPEDIYEIHVDVPTGADRIAVDFDALLVNTISDHQLLLTWNTVVLYPRGVDKRELMIEPSIVLPVNWKQGSALRVSSQTGSRVNFAPVSLERLIDSPVLAGEFFRAVPLASVWPAELDVTGDSQAAIDSADDAHAFALFAKLVDQDRSMFGFRHWQTFRFLVAQSDARPLDGLEHGDSAYSSLPDAGLSKREVLEKAGWPNLAHEQSHSWNGKYRRPRELYSKPDYQGPERTTLLWVYEGLAQYAGMLLATRAGFNDAAYMRDHLARIAADLTHETGRGYTALVDTATENWVLPFDSGWKSLRREQDYYDEGALIWLRADTIIREQTQSRRSLDDFLRSFFGLRDTEPMVAPYTREDVEKALSAVCAFDWHAFFETHVYQVNPKPPTEGLEAAGWRLAYNATPNNAAFYAETDRLHVSYYANYSIGISVKQDGTIFDVLPSTPADDAGLSPNMTILAVDGRVYSVDVLNEAIANPHNGRLSMVVRNFDSVESHEIHYAGGIRFPHLERVPGSRDYLTEILEPRSYTPH